MSSIKTTIKNELWRWNYIIPFVNRHRFDEKGAYDLLRRIVRAYYQIHPIKAHGETRTVGKDTRRLLETIQISVHLDSQFVYFLDCTKTIAVPGNVLGNFTIAYDKIIQGTFDELATRAIGNDHYGKEAEEVIEGVRQLVARIVETLKIVSLPKIVQEKRIRDFSRILDEPAEHFDEALQRILFFNQIMWQTRHRLNGLGRLDRILGDLYASDLVSGYLDCETAEVMVLDFLNQLSRYADYKSDALQGDIGQIIVLGGLEPNGSYFHNELTEIFLKEQAKLKKPDPKTLLRVSDKMPRDLLRGAVECLASATGSPLFSNDDVIIPALLDFGMPVEDAYSYCTSACWEPFIVGKSLDQNNIAVFDYFTTLDEILKSDPFSDYDSLVDAYLHRNEERFTQFLKSLDTLKWASDPLVSLFTDGCSEKRRDISDGAARYNNYGITTVALSNTVDSLLNIKRLVFEEKCCSWTALMQARKKDFEGEEELFAGLLGGKRYGRDDEEAEKLTNLITSSLSKQAKAYRNRLGGTVKFGVSSPGYLLQGKRNAADVSGRKSGQPYNTHISCMNAPYTEVVRFAAQLKYTDQRFNGNVVDFFLPGDFLQNNMDKFVLFLQGAIREGFFQMQMNIMDSKILIDAKAHPERHAGLIVRVWGFSAYFNDLPESYQDMLIERALAAEKSE